MTTQSAMQELERPIVPLIRDYIKVPDSTLEFSAACFQGSDWSLKPLQEPGDVLRNPGLASKLREAMRYLEADRIYAPNPTEFNGAIVQPSLIDKCLVLGGGITLFRNKAVPADGTFLRSPRDAGIFSAGGCGMLLVSYRDQLIFAHAGRECLLDRTWVLKQGTEKSRARISVVDSILEALDVPASYTARAAVHVWPMWFIKPENFIHRLEDPNVHHRDYNAAARAFLPEVYGKGCALPTKDGVELDLAQIARMQFLREDILPENVHMEHAYLADELPTTRNGGGRYLAAVVRHT